MNIINIVNLISRQNILYPQVYSSLQMNKYVILVHTTSLIKSEYFYERLNRNGHYK